MGINLGVCIIYERFPKPTSYFYIKRTIFIRSPKNKFYIIFIRCIRYIFSVKFTKAWYFYYIWQNIRISIKLLCNFFIIRDSSFHVLLKSSIKNVHLVHFRIIMNNSISVKSCLTRQAIWNTEREYIFCFSCINTINI